MRLYPSATLGKCARRYWQLADSDDALPPHGALSTAAFRCVTQQSDERIEGQTFDPHDGPRAPPERCGLEPHLHSTATA